MKVRYLSSALLVMVLCCFSRHKRLQHKCITQAPASCHIFSELALAGERAAFDTTLGLVTPCLTSL